MAADTPSQYYFTSDLFPIDPGEDVQTNPGRHGKQLAHWLRDRLVAAGQPIESIQPEDWGWAVVCRSKPYRLWIGCGNIDEADGEERATPPPASANWTCFIECRAPLLKRLLGNTEAVAASADLSGALLRVLTDEPRIKLIEEP